MRILDHINKDQKANLAQLVQFMSVSSNTVKVLLDPNRKLLKVC